MNQSIESKDSRKFALSLSLLVKTLQPIFNEQFPFNEPISSKVDIILSICTVYS